MRKKCFQHEYEARNTPGIQLIMRKHGMGGVGAYWCIVEILFENGGKMDVSSFQEIAFELHVTPELVESIVFDFGLFEWDENRKSFWSKRIIEEVERKRRVSETKRLAISKRWQRNAAESDSVSPVKRDRPKPAETPPPRAKEGNLFGGMSEPEKPPAISQPPGKRTRFIPPTVEEVRQYCNIKQYDIDPETFVAFYESKGWMIGKNKMKNWHMALVTWMKSEERFKNSRAPATNRQTAQSIINKNCNNEWR